MTAKRVVVMDSATLAEAHGDFTHEFAGATHTLTLGNAVASAYTATDDDAVSLNVADATHSATLLLNVLPVTDIAQFDITVTAPNKSYSLYGDTTGTLTWKGDDIWYAGNDGPGSGLDADLLDGQHAAAFQAADAQLTSLAALSYAGNAGKVVAVNAGATDFELITVAGTGTVTSVDITAPAAGITASGGPITTAGSITLALANDLAAVEGLASTGIVRRTAADTWSAGTVVAVSEVASALKTGAIMATFDGGGSAVAAGAVVHVRAYYNGAITGAYLRGDGQTGSAVVDVRKDAVTTLPPTTSICASAKPTISSAEYSDDTTLTGWTINFSAGDEFLIVVESCSTFEKLHLQLTTVRT